MRNFVVFFLVLVSSQAGCVKSFLDWYHMLPNLPKLFNSERCYTVKGYSLGCYDNKKPFNDLPLPWDPSKINPRFYLFTRSNTDERDVKQMDLDLPIPAEFNPSLETKLIIHGFMQSWYAPWMHDMKDELLKKGDFNVILVDWKGGAQVGLSRYENAASNIRVVAAYLGTLLNRIAEETGSEMSNVHCIGHSLGAQTCGFTGKHINTPFRRISGLDPAGPNFKDKEPEGRLDKSDAIFVDSIHSNGRGSFTLDLGIGHQVAHVDFIPNGGGLQPGCKNRRRKRSYDAEEAADQRAIIGLQAAPSCSHSRSFEIFTESINSDCPFTAVPCESFESDTHEDCGTCEGDDCQLMGYYADTRPGRGIFYAKTDSKAPYCLGNKRDP